LGKLRTLLLSVILILCFALPGLAIEKRLSEPNDFSTTSMLGLRLGAWMTDINESLQDAGFGNDFSDAGVFAEFWYDLRLTRALMFEFSAGASSLGETTVRTTSGRAIVDLSVFPIMAQIKISPVTVAHARVFPYLTGGAGLIVGRNSLRGVTDFDVLYEFNEQSEADLNWTAGGGIDIVVADQIALNISAKYFQVDFGDGLLGINDYSAFTVAAGASYLIFK
jgi:opacity protein-like surface antigen